MSEMFNNYDKKYITIPDNRHKVLRRKKEYKDTIVLGADNEHSFEIPYHFEEILFLDIAYKQGTENVLTYCFDMNKFIPVDDDNPEDSVYEYKYMDNDRVRLYILSNDQIDEQLKNSESSMITYCVLTYPVNVADSLVFNNYNKNVYVQLKATLNPVEVGTQDEDSITEFSSVYKIEIIDSILKDQRVGE